MAQASSKWPGRTDGMPWMHRTLIWLLRFINVRVLYAVMDIVIVFYMLFAHRFYIASYHYFRERYKKKPLKAFGDVYRTFRQFGQVIIDRFAVYAGKTFQFEIEGNEHVVNAMEKGNGCILLSAHVGNFEMAGYFLRPTRQMYALLYGGEKSTILENRKRMFRANGINMITATDDWSYLYDINDALSEGNLFALFADRQFGSDKAVRCSVLGETAVLPKGPFAVANMYKEADVVTVFVMKDSAKKYHVYIHKIEAQSSKEYAQQFAEQLTDIVEHYPYQWYNFYEFWQ